MTETPPTADRPSPSRWRRLGLGYAHPGALRAWALVLLGLFLQWLWMPPGPAPWLVFAGDVPLLLLIGWGSGGRWVRWGLLYGFLHYALGFLWLTHIHYGQVLVCMHQIKVDRFRSEIVVDRLHGDGERPAGLHLVRCLPYWPIDFAGVDESLNLRTG